MNENDLIAEYVKEHYPEILQTIHFVFFKLGKELNECVKPITDIFKKITLLEIEELKETTQKAKEERQMMNDIVYVKAIVQGENASGQKLVKLVAQNTDGIKPFYTENKDLIIFGVDLAQKQEEQKNDYNKSRI